MAQCRYRRNVIWQLGRLQHTACRRVAAVRNLEWRSPASAISTATAAPTSCGAIRRTGANVIWKSANSPTPQAVTGVTNLAWKAASTGDFNGDGKCDIAWRNTATGANVAWLSANAATSCG